MALTHVDLLEEWRIPVWSSGFWALRFAGITGGLLQDFLAEGAATGLGATWIYQFTPRPFDESFDQPDDAVAALGQDAGRPLYPNESVASCRLRLRAKWAFWTGSPKAGLVEELTAAGIGTPTVVVPNDAAAPVDSHTDHWSRFWLFFSPGDHPITGPGKFWYEHVVGTDRLGPDGLTAEYHHTLRAIVRRYKPVQWVPWEYRFELADGSEVRIRGRAAPDPDYVYFTP